MQKRALYAVLSLLIVLSATPASAALFESEQSFLALYFNSRSYEDSMHPNPVRWLEAGIRYRF